MEIPAQERDVLKQLSLKVAEIAALPVQKEKAELWRRLNSLDSVRPMVLMYQYPWDEIEGADPEPLRPRCEQSFLREAEIRLRRLLYQWEHFPGDMVVEPRFELGPVLEGDSFGLGTEETTIRQADAGRAIGNAIQSHHYIPQIRDETDIEKIKIPRISHNADATKERSDALSEVFGGSLEVVPGIGFGPTNIGPWDALVHWTGVQEILTDLALRPDYVHAVMDRLTTAYEARLDQYDSMGLLRLNNGPEIVGQGGLGYTDELPGADYDPDHVRYHNRWGGGMAQVFSEVSPEMHREFALRYEARCLNRFPLVYYGCCEPLHNKVGLVREMLPNVRKISMSPKADDRVAAEEVGKSLVYSSKPNPASLATDRWHPDRAREELDGILRTTAARGCHVELVLKDISTVRSEPQRLAEWSDIALELAEEYAW